jgi:hypothetical protein
MVVSRDLGQIRAVGVQFSCKSCEVEVDTLSFRRSWPLALGASPAVMTSQPQHSGSKSLGIGLSRGMWRQRIARSQAVLGKEADWSGTGEESLISGV